MNWTTGPLDPAVYWRRRAVIGAPIVIVLLALATCAITADDSREDTSKTANETARQEPTDTPRSAPPTEPAITLSPLPSQSASPAASPSPSQPPGPTDCADNDLSVTVSLAHQKYPTKSKLPVKLSVTNTSGKPCIRDVGAGQQEVLVNSGDKRIWSSDDCTGDRAADKRTLAANEKRTYWVTWSSTTSAPGCQQSGTAGAGTYQVVGRIGGKFSAPVNVTLI